MKIDGYATRHMPISANLVIAPELAQFMELILKGCRENNRPHFSSLHFSYQWGEPIYHTTTNFPNKVAKS
jgi:hypothetical protein